MSKLSRKLMVEPGQKVRLAKIDPDSTDGVKNKAEAEGHLKKNIARLAQLQYLLYAEKKRAVLIVFQAMDAGGKDGTIRHVMSGLNPQGCRVTPFKAPAGEEREHDFLWRVHKATPAFGEIGIFNRSHYEDVLVVRVQNLAPKAVWSERYKHLNAFERLLDDCGVKVVKFFLHISREEQQARLQERLQDREKHWKVSAADFEDRKRWDDYMAAYEEAFQRCSTSWAPWYIIPANKKWYRNLAVSQIIAEALEDMDLQLPKPAAEVETLVAAVPQKEK
jgi:PPK2 family polyphosphate:nucleotide phosphotransferase